MSEPLHPEVVILNAALEKPAAERAAYLDQACAGDAALRRQVETLLAAHPAAETFLDTPVPGHLALGSAARGRAVVTEKPGDRIGRYKLLQQIGEGGCGVVYMAEQEEPVRRRVALKVIKLGMDTREVIARFDAERQALALMDHPHIAKVLDAGATETGRPYFVMELVRGVRLTEFCDENKLPTAERLRLFIQVCQAIQHAHQKGVIHRDLKPSNILVTRHEPDLCAMPKVIDFGIAKATVGRLTDRTLFTAFEQFIGTPAYMSPEQALMTSLDIDTRSDIYSLGVLLYELLTGQTPFDARALSEAGFEEMRRTIREQEPPRPSTRLSTMAAAALQTTARLRHTDAPRLLHVVRGDLDWIVMKCLEKDRTRRYESASALAADLQRYLQHEPVVARPPGRVYQFRKLVRRHRLAFVTGGAVVAALVLGLVLALWQYAGKSRAYNRAVAAEKNQDELRQLAQARLERVQVEAKKSQEVARFLKDMLKQAGPSLALGRDSAMLRDILDETARRVGKDLTNQPEVQIDLLSTLTLTYRDLKQFEPMKAMALERVRLARAFYPGDHRETALALLDAGDAARRLDQLAEAESFTREGLAMSRHLPDDKQAVLSTALHNLALVLKDQGRLDEAEELGREVVARDRREMDTNALGDSLLNLGGILRSRGKWPDAEKCYREALGIQTNRWGFVHPEVADALNNLSLGLSVQGKLEEAEALSRQALAINRKLHGTNSPAIVGTLNNLASILHGQRRLPDAAEVLQEALGIQRTLPGNPGSALATSLGNLGVILTSLDRLTEAAAAHREALAIQRAVFGNAHVSVARSLHNVALTLERQRKFSEAEPYYREYLAVERARPAAANRETLVAVQDMALFLLEWSRAEPDHPAAATRAAEGNDLLQEYFPAVRQRYAGEPARLEDRLSPVALVWYQHGRYAEAEPLFREILQSMGSRLPPDNDGVLTMKASLARLLSRWAWAEATNTSQVASSDGNPQPSPRRALDRAREAEGLLNESLAMLQQGANSNSTRIADFKGGLGDAMVAATVADANISPAEREARFSAAELLLVEADARLQQSRSTTRRHKRSSLERLIRLYEAWPKPDQATVWRQKLAGFDQDSVR